MPECNCTNSGQTSNPSNADKKFLMVEATSSEAANCPTGAAQAIATESCIKTDKTYDKILSDIGVPAIGSSVEVLVCDGSFYRVNQYVRFFDSGCALKIIAISGNRIQLYNGGCDGTNPLPGNPSPGTVIDRNSYFGVIDEPFCQSSEELKSDIENILADFDELCLPNLKDADADDKQRPVGYAVENLVNAGFKKCMRKALGWFFKNGHAYYENPDLLPESGASSYRQLYRHKTTGKIEERRTTAESVSGSGKYIRIVGDSEDVLLPNASIFMPFSPRTIKETGPNLELASMNIAISDGNPYSENFTLNYSEITNLEDYMYEDFFYALIAASIGFQTNALGLSCIGNLTLNGVDVIACGSNQRQFSSVAVPIRIEKSDKKLAANVMVNSTSVGKMYIKLQLLGIYI